MESKQKNIEILNNWLNEYKEFKKLNFLEACSLYQEMLNTKSSKDVYDTIILGTMWVIHDFLSKSILITMDIPTYDINDLIQATLELWIEKINEGQLLNAKSYRSILNTKDYKTILEKLNFTQDLVSNSKSENIINVLTDVVYYYIAYASKEESISIDDFIAYLECETPMNLNNRILQIISIYEHDIVRIQKELTNNNKNKEFISKLTEQRKVLLKPIIATYLNERTIVSKEDHTPEPNDSTEEIDELLERIFFSNIDLELNIREQSTLQDRYGYDVFENSCIHTPKTYKEIAKEQGVSIESVRRCEKSAIAKLQKKLNR